MCCGRSKTQLCFGGCLEQTTLKAAKRRSRRSMLRGIWEGLSFLRGSHLSAG